MRMHRHPKGRQFLSASLDKMHPVGGTSLSLPWRNLGSWVKDPGDFSASVDQRSSQERVQWSRL